MALSADTVWEIRANGTANGGGGFVTGATGTDYSQQDAVQIARTDIVIDAVTNTNVTSAATPFTTAEIGNLINITAGTGFTTGRYEITAVDVSNIATLDRAVGTVGSTGGSGDMGGAMIMLDANFEAVVGNNTVYVKADGTYTLTEVVAVATVPSVIEPIYLYGYNTTRGDNPTETSRPLVACGIYSVTFGQNWIVSHLRGTGTSTEVLKTGTNSGIMYNTKGDNSSGTANRSGLQVGTTVGTYTFTNCEAVSTNGYALLAATNTTVYGCYIHDSTYGIIYASSTGLASIVHCIIDTCDNGITFSGTSNNGSIFNNTIYNCATRGINVIRPVGAIMNNIIDSCGTGINRTFANFVSLIDYNNFNNNTTDVTNATKGVNTTAIDPSFVDAPNGNFAIGSALYSGSSLGAFPGALTTGYLDQGAVQHQGGGGGTIARFAGF